MRKFNLEKFTSLTENMTSNPDFREWVKQFKLHPDILYFVASSKLGIQFPGLTKYFDGVKHPFRVIDHFLMTRDNSAPTQSPSEDEEEQ